MKQAFITGTSRGLGKALALELIGQGWHVFGIGRTHSITDPAYTGISVDLSKHGGPQEVHFSIDPEVEDILLVNNSGTLGEIGYMGKITDPLLENGLYLNLTAPFILVNRFLEQTADYGQRRTILNISSGAAKTAYDGWAMYCSSKAGLDMLSEAVAEELRLSNDTRTRIFSLAPGIIDTAMQAEIRTSEAHQFSRIDKFVELHEQEQLSDPAVVAQRIVALISDAKKHPVRLDIRDLD